MYDYIKGQLDRLTPAAAVVEAGGVGYYINISLQTFSSIESATEVKLYTHFIVREDAQVLYGFYTLEEREVFRALIGVSGVGGNTARMILSTFSSDEVRSIIATGQADVLKSVKGLGIKTAQKIIVELRDKLGVSATEEVALPIRAAANETYSEALSALVMLGFTKPASEKVLRALVKEQPQAHVEELEWRSNVFRKLLGVDEQNVKPCLSSLKFCQFIIILPPN